MNRNHSTRTSGTEQSMTQPVITRKEMKWILEQKRQAYNQYIEQTYHTTREVHGLCYSNETDFPDERLMQILHFVDEDGFMGWVDGEIRIKKKPEGQWKSGHFSRYRGRNSTAQIAAFVDQDKTGYPLRSSHKRKVIVELHYDNYNETTDNWSHNWRSYWKFVMRKPLKRNGLSSILAKKKDGSINIRSPGGYIETLILSIEESLVLTLAHEFRHMNQCHYPNDSRYWGSRGKYSELDADAYAIRKLREWRAIWSPRDFMEGRGNCNIPWNLIEGEDWWLPSRSMNRKCRICSEPCQIEEKKTYHSDIQCIATHDDNTIHRWLE